MELLRSGHGDIDVEAVLEWLAIQDELASGFLHNARVIRSAFVVGNAIVATVDGDLAGFLVWEFDGGHGAELLIQVVGADHRRHGIGRAMVDAALATMPRPLFVFGQCCPPSSERYWRKLGYDDLPTSYASASRDGSRCLVRLIQDSHGTDSDVAPEAISLRLRVWESEPWNHSPSDPPGVDITFPAVQDSGRWSPTMPIALFANYDWQACLEGPGLAAVEEKLKHLPFAQTRRNGCYFVILPGH